MRICSELNYNLYYRSSESFVINYGNNSILDLYHIVVPFSCYFDHYEFYVVDSSNWELSLPGRVSIPPDVEIISFHLLMLHFYYEPCLSIFGYFDQSSVLLLLVSIYSILIDHKTTILSMSIYLRNNQLWEHKKGLNTQNVFIHISKRPWTQMSMFKGQRSNRTTRFLLCFSHPCVVSGD